MLLSHHSSHQERVLVPEITLERNLVKIVNPWQIFSPEILNTNHQVIAERSLLLRAVLSLSFCPK